LFAVRTWRKPELDRIRSPTGSSTARRSLRTFPRACARELWRVDPRWLQEAQDDATLVAIREQERAGLDIVTDGEIRRESYSNRFATALHGIDVDNPGTTLNRSGNPIPVPRITGPVRRDGPIAVDDLRFLCAGTDRLVKVTIPGPFTMTQQAQNDFYEHDEELALSRTPTSCARRWSTSFAAGADVVQLDEPWMESRAEEARRYALATLERALDGVEGTTALHICFGYPAFVPDHPPAYAFLSELAASPVDQISIETAQAGLDLGVLATLPGKTIILGVIALDTADVETPEIVAERIRRALPHKGTGELVAAPDCGMKYLPREAAFAKLQALVAGAQLVRADHEG
jgi:5-methyltetrahydropteroyltriglutamate--homocysteine methyltransferase